MLFITVTDNKLTFHAGADAGSRVLGAFDAPAFEEIWGMLDAEGDADFICSSSLDEDGNEALCAVLDGAAAEWSDVDNAQHAQHLGFTCKVARKDGRWIAWASLNGACRVIDQDTTYETERKARAAALRFAHEDTFRPASAA